jgi:ubiquinone/menaquinone biosynthesis C-methylase UbiE
MEAHYLPNWRLTQAHGLTGYNCGYAESPGCESFAEHQRSLVWRLLADVSIGSDSTIVDVGCGIGGPTDWIHGRFQPRMIIGLEYCWSSVRAATDRWKARKRRSGQGNNSRPVFLQGDAHSLPLADASVDVVFNLESALHYADKDAFITECRRVLKPGGTLCLGDITTNLKVLFTPMMLLNSLPSQFNSNIHLWSGDDYEDAFRKHGMAMIRHEEASLPVAASLADGLAEIKQRGWEASRGYRGRWAFLAVLQNLLNSGQLTYDLFSVRRD